MDVKPLAKRSFKGGWFHISQIESKFEDRGINWANVFIRKVGIGDKTQFWKDVWCCMLC